MQRAAEPPFPTRDELSRLVRLQHPWKILAGLPGTASIDAAMTAGVLGTDLATYAELREEIEQGAARAAADLLADPAFAEQVDGLPFGPGDVVVALGDSLTADLGSWARILSRVLELRRGGDGIRLVNAGVSGETTADVRKRLVAVAREEPDWVLTLVGTNDARRHGRTTTDSLVSREETGRNLELIRDLLAERTTARRLWMTPPPVREELIAQDRRFLLNELAWDDAELEARTPLTHALGEPTLDLAPAFGRPCPPELVLADGLHPSLEGQVRILRAVTERLSAL